MTERFDSDWLALREPFDQAARSIALARRLAESLPKRPRLVDLAGGTGSMFRYLAPIIGRGQDWVLLDADPALLDEAFGRTSAWARQRGYAASAQGETLSLSTPMGLWRLRLLQRDLASHGWRDDMTEADAILCSALLDLVSACWFKGLCGSLSVPFLACLTADGRDAWRPHHALDVRMHAAFRRDMRRDKGLGPALGTAAAPFALRILAAHGFATASAPSDWRIPRSALGMQRALIDGIADAAHDIRRPGAVAHWRERRLRQALRGRLAISIGHRDILALPSGGQRHAAGRNSG